MSKEIKEVKIITHTCAIFSQVQPCLLYILKSKSCISRKHPTLKCSVYFFVCLVFLRPSPLDMYSLTLFLNFQCFFSVWLYFNRCVLIICVKQYACEFSFIFIKIQYYFVLLIAFAVKKGDLHHADTCPFLCSKKSQFSFSEGKQCGCLVQYMVEGSALTNVCFSVSPVHTRPSKESTKSIQPAKMIPLLGEWAY